MDPRQILNQQTPGHPNYKLCVYEEGTSWFVIETYTVNGRPWKSIGRYDPIPMLKGTKPTHPDDWEYKHIEADYDDSATTAM